MIKFYLYSSDDSIEFSHKIEQFQNNPKISIVDIQYQVDKEIYTTKNRFSDTAYNHEDITYYVGHLPQPTLPYSRYDAQSRLA